MDLGLGDDGASTGGDRLRGRQMRWPESMGI